MVEAGVECFSVDEGEAFPFSEVRTEPIVRKQARNQTEERTDSIERIG